MQEKIQVRVDGLTVLEEAEIILHEILGELKKKKEWELATKINHILGKIEALKKIMERAMQARALYSHLQVGSSHGVGVLAAPLQH